MNRNQQLLDKLLTALDLEFKDATEGMEDGWYVWRNSESWPVDEYILHRIIDGEMLDTSCSSYQINICEPYGQLAGPILGR